MIHTMDFLGSCAFACVVCQLSLWIAAAHVQACNTSCQWQNAFVSLLCTVACDHLLFLYSFPSQRWAYWHLRIQCGGTFHRKGSHNLWGGSIARSDHCAGDDQSLWSSRGTSLDAHQLCRGWSGYEYLTIMSLDPATKLTGNSSRQLWFGCRCPTRICRAGTTSAIYRCHS